MTTRKSQTKQPTANEIAASLFAQMEQPKDGLGLVRKVFRVVGNITRDSGDLVAEVTQGFKAGRVGYAVAKQEAEQHHRKVIEARIAKLLEG